MSYFAVLIGGLVGGVLRYGVGMLMPASGGFPMGTLSVNLMGSLMLGLFYGYADARQVSPWVRAAIGTGCIGAFTTFSSFCIGLSQAVDADVWMALVYVVICLAGGPLLAYLGARLVLSTVPKPSSETGDLSA